VKILVVAEDARKRVAIESLLTADKFVVHGCSTGEAALDYLAAQIFDCVIIESDGVFDELRTIRSNPTIPILTIGQGEGSERLGAIIAGSDYYLPQPVNKTELAITIRCLVNRTHKLLKLGDYKKDEYNLGQLRIDNEEHMIYVNEEPVEFPNREYGVLAFFVANMGKAVSRTTIINRVWGEDFDGDDRVVDVHICRIRDKIADTPIKIVTVRGVGYRCIKTPSLG